jgi:transglutaminase-like putative cysteine protease
MVVFMPKKLKLLFSLLISLILIHKTSKTTHGQEQFETSYSILYKVKPDGETVIDQNIEIKNREEDVLATTYSVTVKQMEIYEVSGTDTAGNLEIDVKRDTEKKATIINATLNEKVIGEGRSNKLKISYKTQDLANKVGSIWNVNLPKTANLSNVKDYEATLQIPEEFGPLIFISPSPKEENEKEGYITYKYSKEELSGEAVTAAFGANQMVNFKLNYHLKNDSILPNKQEIALPPTIKGQQEIYYKKLDPLPEKIYEDEDGNIMAIYRVKSKSSQKIQLTGSAKISGRQIKPSVGGKMSDLPPDLVKNYTKEQEYWETESEKIKTTANDLFDANNTVSENAQEAYEYITEHLEYNNDIVQETYIERKGALEAITRDEAWACMEFTDLFVALTRAMGIPARELNGYAFSTAEDFVPVSIDLKSGDMLHAWAEYYDPNFGWVPVDPTWGTTSGVDYFTKLDTNHLAFVIKGLDSQYPYPAGSYRIDPDEKQVNVDFAENKIDFTPKINITKKFNWNPLQLLRGKQRYKLTHQEGPILFNVNETEKTLLPFQDTSIYLNKNNEKIPYEDYNNIIKDLTL